VTNTKSSGEKRRPVAGGGGAAAGPLADEGLAPGAESTATRRRGAAPAGRRPSTSTADANRRSSRTPMSPSRGSALQHVFILHDPDTPWHLHWVATDDSTACWKPCRMSSHIEALPSNKLRSLAVLTHNSPKYLEWNLA